MDKVLIVTHNNFPYEDAGAIRDMAFAKIFQEMGMEVSCICHNSREGSGIIEKVNFVSIYKKYENFFEKAESYIELFHRFMDAFNSYIKKNGQPKIIHAVIGNFKIFSFLKEYSKKNKCILIYTPVEWYSPSEFRMGILSRQFLLNEFFNRFAIDKSISIIAISTYFEKYYKNKGINTCRIPVIMDCKNNTVVFHRNKNKIFISYVGSAAQKDYLGNVIRAFAKLEERVLKKFCFQVIGVSEKQIMQYGWISGEDRKKIGDVMLVHGRLPHNKAIEILQASDFSIMVRPSKRRYTKAGFPTKSVEAMCNGVAVMCNITSDLGLYLKDMENSVIIKDESTESIVNAIKKVACLKSDDIQRIRRQAKKTAEEYFDYREYVKKMECLIGLGECTK